MSTTDVLSPWAPLPESLLPEALQRPLRGVSFEHHLIVVASRLDAIPTPVVLAWLGVSEAAHGRVEARWEELVSDALAREGSDFDALYTELLERAVCLWGRPVEPLDDDLEAWLTYERHAAENPALVARTTALTPGDALRLARRWRPRLGDAALARRAARALVEPLSPLPAISAPPLRFPPDGRAPRGLFGGLP